MAKQRTKAVRKTAAAGDPVAEPVQATEPEPKSWSKTVEEFGKPITDDPSKAVNSLLAQFEEMTKQNLKLQREVEALRTTAGVQDKEDGGNRVVTGEAPSIEIPVPRPATAESGEFAVFRSPFPGFKQVISRSEVIRHPNGDYHVEPPLLAEFTRGVCVLYDEKEIELMRAKLEQKTRKGEADFIEITDPGIKKDAMKGQRVITSGSVTVETPAESLV